MLMPEDKESVVKLRLEHADETLRELRGIVEGKFWYAAANRMYYACYYVVSALLIQNDITASTHSGTIRMFGLHFVKTGLVSEELGAFYSQVFEFRQAGDYDDWVIIEEKDVLPLMGKIDTFISTIKALIIKN